MCARRGAGNSEPIRFAFRTRARGPQRVRVLAFAGGTFLSELEVEVSVEPDGRSVDGKPTIAELPDIRARGGEVTLQVQADQDRVVFQLLSNNRLFEPVLAQGTADDPPAATWPSSAIPRSITSPPRPNHPPRLRTQRRPKRTLLGWDSMPSSARPVINSSPRSDSSYGLLSPLGMGATTVLVVVLVPTWVSSPASWNPDLTGTASGA